LRRHVAAPGRKVRKVAPAAAPVGKADGAVFERLRAWRAEIAKQHGVPAFVVFHDETLRAIAAAQPATLEQLRGISGIGEKKLANYGAHLLELLGKTS
jgi:ATP-dependent DNA helicase RecQ